MRSPSVMEAANQVYGINLDLNVTLLTTQNIDNKVHVSAGDEINFALQGEPVLVQWRTWDMRDNWMDHPEYSAGESEVSVTHEMLVERLEYLPGNTIIGNQTLMVRAVLGIMPQQILLFILIFKIVYLLKLMKNQIHIQVQY